MRARRSIRAQAAAVLAVALAVLPAQLPTSPPAFATTSWWYERSDLAPLRNSTQWILKGSRLTNGACRYQYPVEPAVVPESGWVIRSIAIDPVACRKLIEEGIPTEFSHDVAAVETAMVGGSDSSMSFAAASTKSAWQRVVWKDVFGILVNAVMVQVNWTYNGSTVWGGSTDGAWQWNYATNWQLLRYGLTDLYGPNASYYRGQGTATFYNNWFCRPLPAVYTYYYYVRMWGHPNGMATRSQSSDSVDECLPLHFDIESAYGQWPG